MQFSENRPYSTPNTTMTANLRHARSDRSLTLAIAFVVMRDGIVEQVGIADGLFIYNRPNLLWRRLRPPQ